MVRGINRTVIEINDTGSDFFEKVILFVTPEYGNMSTRHLKAEADRIINEYYPEIKDRENIRAVYRKRKMIKMCSIIAGAIIAVFVTAFLIFK